MWEARIDIRANEANRERIQRDSQHKIDGMKMMTNLSRIPAQ
jgi:hypothetical protein